MFHIFTISDCPYCKKAIDIAKKYNVNCKEILVPSQHKEKYKKQHNMKTFPQILWKSTTDTTHVIGGSSDFEQHIESLLLLKSKYSAKTVIDMMHDVST
jgi:glutaredoxin